jgi:hypothetical protein
LQQSIGKRAALKLRFESLHDIASMKEKLLSSKPEGRHFCVENFVILCRCFLIRMGHSLTQNMYNYTDPDLGPTFYVTRMSILIINCTKTNIY